MQTFDCTVIKHTFSPVNRCIYCGDMNGPFSDEHIIPYGINGEMILQKASCKNCARITAKFEQAVLRRMFGAVRVHQGLRTRRPKERPQNFETFIDTGNGFERREIPVQDHPHIMTMIELPPPQILHRSGGINQGKIRVWFRDIQGNTQERVNRLGKGVEMKQIIPVGEFCRLLAKIAHSFAVATLGIDSFNPSLLDFILDRKQNVLDYIGGGDENSKFIREETHLHQIVLSDNFNPDRMDLAPVVIADVCLFSCFGAPSYQVVVGRRTQSE